MTALQYSENYLVTTIHLGSTGVTRQNIKMQKTSEIQPISEVFRYPPTGVSTQNIEAAGWPKRVHYRKRRGLYPCEGSERYRSTVYTDSKPIKS